MMKLSRDLAILLASVYSLSSTAVAQDDERVVALSATSAGAGYRLQGEYVGYLQGGYHPQCIGLQVIIDGQESASAVEYRGGLPGAGWEGSERNRLTGYWRNGLAKLSGDNRRILVFGDELRVYDGGVVLRGRIHKVHRRSPTLGLAAPYGALQIFGGGTPRLDNAHVTVDGLLEEGSITIDEFQDFLLHVEFRTPFMPNSDGQKRGNSGVYIQERYEVQILDSFGLEGLFNECGGLYRTRAPSLNMCLPPLVWQTYDIQFRAARFDGEGNKSENARITVRHNGVVIHNDIEIPNKTGAGKQEGPTPGRIRFQDHNDPVRFRNIWILPEPENVHRAKASDRYARGNVPSLYDGRFDLGDVAESERALLPIPRNSRGFETVR